MTCFHHNVGTECKLLQNDVIGLYCTPPMFLSKNCLYYMCYIEGHRRTCMDINTIQLITTTKKFENGIVNIQKIQYEQIWN